jgi:hypothetical protein
MAVSTISYSQAKHSNATLETLKLTPLQRSAVPPPMALCEIDLVSNAIDIAFSKAGTKVAALTALGVSVYHWALSATPVPTPQLQSFYPFSDLSARPRRISFLNETEVYILKNRFCTDEIERTCLDTRETMAVFRSKNSERVSFIFPDLARNVLWFLQQGVNGKPSSYSTVSPESGNRTSVTTWNESPVQDTCWAQATQLGNGEVWYYGNLQTFLALLIKDSAFCSRYRGREHCLPISGSWQRIVPRFYSLQRILSSPPPRTCSSLFTSARSMVCFNTISLMLVRN